MTSLSLLTGRAVVALYHWKIALNLDIDAKLYYEGHPINRGNFLIMQEFVPLKHRNCNH